MKIFRPYTLDQMIVNLEYLKEHGLCDDDRPKLKEVNRLISEIVFERSQRDLEQAYGKKRGEE